MLLKTTFAASCLVVFLASCGGGDSSWEAPETDPQPTAPVLAIAAQASSVPLPSGTTGTLTLVVSNPTAVAMTDVVIDPRLAPGLVQQAFLCTAQGPVFCPQQTGTTFTLSRFPAGAALTLDLQVAIAPGSSGELISTPTARSGSGKPAYASTLAILKAYSADVVVTAVAPARPVRAGTLVSFGVTISNAGPDSALNVDVQNALGRLQSLAGIQCIASGGGTCPTVLGARMQLPVLPAGGSITVMVGAQVQAGASGSLENVFTATAAGDPKASNNAVVRRAMAFAADVPGTTTATFQSTAGDQIADGGTYSYSQADAGFHLWADPGFFRMWIHGDDLWDAHFKLPAGETVFTPKTYTNLARYPFHDDAVGGLSITGRSASCNQSVGRFTINHATYVGGALAAIDISFEQQCDTATVPLTGRITWSASDDTQPPGRVLPIPELWQPAQAMPATGSYVYLESEVDDFIGKGGQYLHTKKDALIYARSSWGSLYIGVGADQDWAGDFLTSYVMDRIKPGYYPDVRGTASWNPTKPHMTWSGNSRTCGPDVSGWFVIDNIVFEGDKMVLLDMRFEQHCSPGRPALRGKVHWDASDHSTLPGPVNPPPDLWTPAPDVTFPDANYLYVASDSGDVLGEGQTATLLKPAVYANHHSVRALVDGWLVSFEPKYTQQQLAPGYYGILTGWNHEVGNSVRGKLWVDPPTGSCSIKEGWFIVDNAVYDKLSELQAIDVRFEIRCTPGTAALRGKLHWVRPAPW